MLQYLAYWAVTDATCIFRQQRWNIFKPMDALMSTFSLTCLINFHGKCLSLNQSERMR